jgi:hypothetical protein
VSVMAQAVEAEVSCLLSRHADEVSDDGRRRLVRHGHLPEREIMTGIGPVAVRCLRVAVIYTRAPLTSTILVLRLTTRSPVWMTDWPWPLERRTMT